MIEWVDELRAGFTAEFGTGPRVVTLATSDDDGNAHARCVVVRAVRDNGALVFATDVRSRKHFQVHGHGSAEVCAWLPSLRRQFRLSGRAGLIGDSFVSFPSFEPNAEGLREQVWVEMSEAARALFFWPAPGEPRVSDAAAFPEAVRTGLPPANFEVIYLKVREVDVLDLRRHPHVRRIWTRDASTWTVREVNP